MKAEKITLIFKDKQFHSYEELDTYILNNNLKFKSMQRKGKKETWVVELINN